MESGEPDIFLTPGNICFLPPFFHAWFLFPGFCREAAPKETVPKETTLKEVAPKKAALKVTVSEANISPGIDTMEDAPDTDVSCVYLFLTRNRLLAPFYPNGLPWSSPGTSIRIFLKYCLLHFFPNR